MRQRGTQVANTPATNKHLDLGRDGAKRGALHNLDLIGTNGAERRIHLSPRRHSQTPPTTFSLKVNIRLQSRAQPTSISIIRFIQSTNQTSDEPYSDLNCTAMVASHQSSFPAKRVLSQHSNFSHGYDGRDRASLLHVSKLRPKRHACSCFAAAAHGPVRDRPAGGRALTIKAWITERRIIVGIDGYC